MKMSFKEYLASKERLRETLLVSPIYKMTYIVNRHAKMFTGESHRISMNPNDTIIVEWNYENEKFPVPISIIIKENVHISNVSKLSSEKLQKWLARNTIEK